MAKKKTKKKTFSPGAKLCSMLKYVITVAKGEGSLQDAQGKYCMWGQAAHMVGVTPKKLYSHTNFGTAAADLSLANFDMSKGYTKAERLVISCEGAGTWDKGEGKLAAKQACKAAGKMTVGQFTKLMVKIGLLPQKRKKTKKR